MQYITIWAPDSLYKYNKVNCYLGPGPCEKEVERDWDLDPSREGKRDWILGSNRGSHREENTNTERDGRRVREGEK